jgi:WD40 repeat protein
LPVTLDPATIGDALGPFAPTLRLVVVSACHGGDAGAPGNSMGSVADRIHQAGIEAVVASRFALSVAGSKVLAEVLYGKLLGEPSSLEDAFRAARNRLFEDLGATGLDHASLQLWARDRDGWDTRPVVFAPYRGLLTFEKKHARFFFGRTREVDELVRKLGALVAEDEPRFLVVAGDSGTGKSSMVMAGAVPRLEQEGWVSQVMRPGSDPLAALAEAEAALAEAVQRAPGNEQAGAAPRGLLVVDQLEEVFTSDSSAEDRTRFARRLWRLAGPSGTLGVIATLRFDFFGRCGEIVLNPDTHLRLDKVAVDPAHQVPVAQMDAAQLHEAIEAPARKVGLSLEKGLTERILGDVDRQPGALPLVEHTLGQMWERREGRSLTQACYGALGGVPGALNQHADQVFDGFSRRAPQKGRVARRLLVGLVHLGQDDGPNTSRRERIAKLRPEDAADATRFDEVLEDLVDQRLLVCSGQGEEQTVEVAHEALIRKWKRLGKWTKEERGKLLALEELARWAESSKKHGELLTPGQLLRARELLETYGGEINARERELIEQSIAADAWRKRRARAVVAVVGLAAVLAVVAWAQRNEAQAKTREAHEATDRARRASQMSSARGLLAQGWVGPAAMVLAAMTDPEKVQGWDQLAMDTLAHRIPKAKLPRARSAAWSPDSKRIVTVSDDKTARIWDADGTGDPIVLAGHRGSVMSAAWSPDGKRIVTWSEDRTARVWNADGTGTPIVLEGHGGRVTSAAWAPDGKRIVTASDDKTARVWNADGAGDAVVLEGHKGMVGFAAWSPDGKRIVTASDDKTARVWNADGMTDSMGLGGHKGRVTSAAWSPDGKRIVTTSSDATLAIWNADGTGAPIVLDAHGGIVLFPAWSPDSKRIVTVSMGDVGHVQVWNADGTGDPIALKGHTRWVYSAAWSPDGKRIVTASVDRTARVWNADGTGEPIVLDGHEDEVDSAAWSPDGRHIVTGSHDGNARVWNVDPLVLAGHQKGLTSAAWSPDGRHIVTASWDATARVWNADGTGAPIVLERHDIAVRVAAWSSDGRRIVTVSTDDVPRAWNADGTGAPVVLEGPERHVISAAWKPDGKLVVRPSPGHTAEVLDVEGKIRLGILKGHEDVVVSASWSPDGKHIVTASRDRTARVWHADRSGDIDDPIVLQGHKGWVTSAVWSPDSKRIATLSPDKTVRIWSADGAGNPIVLRGHEFHPTSAAWSSDGKRLATVSIDKTARVWNADGTGYPIVLKGHEGAVTSVAWSPDGNHLVTASDDKAARIWPVTIPALQQALRNASTDCLTPDQRQTYLLETEPEARAAHEACERSHHRTPTAP